MGFSPLFLYIFFLFFFNMNKNKIKERVQNPTHLNLWRKFLRRKRRDGNWSIPITKSSPTCQLSPLLFVVVFASNVLQQN